MSELFSRLPDPFKCRDRRLSKLDRKTARTQLPPELLTK